jgi:hypothetical protein
MARRKRRRSGNYHDRFIALPHYMLRAPVWKTLPSDAKALLIEVWMRHNGMNNGEISFSVREAEEIGISRSVAARMFAVLIERGFLVITRDSAFSVKTKHARLWRLTMEPYRGEPGTKNFMREIVPPSVKQTVKFKTQSGLGDSQSPDRDRELIDEMKLPASVPVKGPQTSSDAGPQSFGRDTYIIPGGDTPPPVVTNANKPSVQSDAGLMANGQDAT